MQHDLLFGKGKEPRDISAKANDCQLRRHNA